MFIFRVLFLERTSISLQQLFVRPFPGGLRSTWKQPTNQLGYLNTHPHSGASSAFSCSVRGSVNWVTFGQAWSCLVSLAASVSVPFLQTRHQAKGAASLVQWCLPLFVSVVCPLERITPPPKCSLSLPGSLLGNPCPNRAHPSCLSNAASLFLHSFMLWGASVGRTEGHRGAHDEGS